MSDREEGAIDPARLRLPGCPGIARVKDDARVSHGPAVIWIGEGTPEQRMNCARRLRSPRGSAVRRPEDVPLLTHGPTVLRVRKRNAVEDMRHTVKLNAP